MRFSDRIFSSRNPVKVLAQIWVEICAPFHIQLQKVFQPFYWTHQLESEISIGQVTIIWPNNSTPNFGSKWLNSNKKILQPTWAWILNQIYSFQVLIKRGKTMEIHLSLGFKKHWINSLSPTTLLWWKFMSLYDDWKVARSWNPSLYLIYGSFLSISSTRWWSHSSGTWTREYSTLPKT
jgi:hypothetical protein